MIITIKFFLYIALIRKAENYPYINGIAKRNTIFKLEVPIQRIKSYLFYCAYKQHHTENYTYIIYLLGEFLSFLKYNMKFTKSNST